MQKLTAYSLQLHAEAPSSAQIGSSLAANVSVVKMVQDEHHLISTAQITSKEYCARLMCRAVQKSQARCNVKISNAEVSISVLSPPVRFRGDPPNDAQDYAASLSVDVRKIVSKYVYNTG